MDKDKYYKFLEDEYDLLVRKEFNTVINDINNVIDEFKEDIELSFKMNKKLFSNYKEIVIYGDITQREITEEGLDLDYVTLYGLLGDAYMSREMYEEAINAFNKAITLSPGNILLMHRKISIFIKTNRINEALDILMKTFKYCYTSYVLMGHYYLLVDCYKALKDYKSAVYILNLISYFFKENDYAKKEIINIESMANEKYDIPLFDNVLEFFKEKNMATPFDLSVYYYSIYSELLKREEYNGALEFLLSSNSLVSDKKNNKQIKKLQKMIKKQD